MSERGTREMDARLYVKSSITIDINTAYLPDVGIRGNGHYSMLKKNTDQIAEYLHI